MGRIITGNRPTSLPEIPEGYASLARRCKVKIIGVGGGGGNAVNYMYNSNIDNVDYLIINTDRQALGDSPIENKIQLGEKGLGAGNNPEIGKLAAEQCAEEITRQLSDNTKIVFVIACLGKGTGTGAAPVVAGIAKSLGCLTIALVTIPFRAEGERRLNQALNGLNAIRQNVDVVVAVTSERIKEEFPDFKVSQAFDRANEVATIGVRGLVDMITKTSVISNATIADIQKCMSNSGDALLGIGEAQGFDREVNALSEALDSTLLCKQDIKRAKNIILNFCSSSGEYEVTSAEIDTVKLRLQSQIQEKAEIISSVSHDDTLGDKLKVTVVLTGLEMTDQELRYQAENILLTRKRKSAERKLNASVVEASDEAINYLGVGTFERKKDNTTSVSSFSASANTQNTNQRPTLTSDMIGQIFGDTTAPSQKVETQTPTVSVEEPQVQPQAEPVVSEPAEPLNYVWGTFENINR